MSAKNDYMNFKKEEVEEKLNFEVEKPKKDEDKKRKKTYQKISTPETIEHAVKQIRSKYPLFPKEFEDKLYTVDVFKILIQG